MYEENSKYVNLRTNTKAKSAKNYSEQKNTSYLKQQNILNI